MRPNPLAVALFVCALAVPAHAIPVAHDQSVTVAIDTPTPVTLQATDSPVAVFRYSIATQPLHGSVSLSGNVATYTPHSGYVGPDSFTWTVFNDVFDTTSAPGTVSITVSPGLTINDVTHVEGHSGTTEYVFTVRLHGATGGAFTVPWSTTDGSATAPADYIAASGTLSFAGTNGETRTLSVFSNGDLTGEHQNGPFTTETFRVVLGTPSPNIAALVDPSGTANIQEDEGPSIVGVLCCDLLNPSGGSGGSTRTITNAHAGYTAVFYIEYNLQTDFGNNLGTFTSGPPLPITFPGADAASMFTFQNGTFITRYYLRTHFLITDTDQTIINPAMNVSGGIGLKDDSTRQSLPQTVTVPVTIDMRAPRVVSVTPNLSLLQQANAGSGTFALTIVYDEAMSNGTAPTIAFPVESPASTLTSTGGSWLDAMTYRATFDVTDADQFLRAVDVQISGAKDSRTNPQTSATVTDLFSIDMHPPVATPQNVTTNEDTPVSITLAGTGGAPLTYSVVTPPAHGTFSGGTYTPDANYHGGDSLTFTASDGLLTSAPATVAIAIQAANDTPAASGRNVSGDEDTPLAITLSGTDLDGDTLTYSVATPPSHGTFSGGTYTPNANYHGSDSFTFTANDGNATSAPATVAITIRAINDRPAAAAQNVATNEDAALALTLGGSDVDGDSLTYSVATPPAHGTFSGGTYTPNANYHGSDSFTFTASDGLLTSEPATVAINVRSVNDRPTAAAQNVATDEDAALAITLAGTDVDGESLTYSVFTAPSHGTFSGGTYTPNANYHGPDSFTFTATDGQLTSEAATVAITVRAVNDRPAATAQNVATNEDTPLAIALGGSDVDGDSLTYSVATPPAHGTFSGGTYTPNANYHGSDSFTFTASDGLLTSEAATVAINVRSVNDRPTAAAQNAATDEDSALAITLAGSDVDGESLTYSVFTAPSHGTFSGGTYTPNANYHGPDSFTFTATDGQLTSEAATVAITVRAVNDRPAATAQNVATNEDTPLAIALGGSDVDGDSLTYSVATPPSHGTFSGGTYTPNPNYHGSDSFTFTASDGLLTSEPATIAVSIRTINDPPVAIGQNVSTDEDAPLAIALGGTDADNDPLTSSLVTPPAHGTFSAGTYTPNANYHGSDSFTFAASDGDATSAPATITITVRPINDRPAAAAQNVATDEDTPLLIALGGSDIDGDPLTYTVVVPPAHGTFANGIYTPSANDHGSDSFTFTASDGQLTSEAATVAIAVRAINDQPVAAAQNVATDEDTPLAVVLAGADADGNPLSFGIVTPPAHGTFADGTYTPHANYHGSDSFTFTASDGLATSSAATIAITIRAINDPPVALARNLATSEDAPLAIAPGGSDVDNDPLTYAIVTPPSHGTFSDGTYTPHANYHGSDSFTFTVTDGNATSAPATVTIDISAVNDRPEATPQTLVTDEDQALAISLGGSDVDGDALTYSVVTPPLHGTFSAGRYMPEPHYHGSDSFTFTASDGNATSAPATVSITILAINDPPAPASLTLATDEDAPLAVGFRGVDVDGDALTYAIVTPPEHGTFRAGTYTPDANYHGSDSFTVSATDGTLTSTPAMVSITIHPVNDAPAAAGDNVSVTAGTTIRFDVLANDVDVDGDPLTVAGTDAPQHGSVVCEPTGICAYTPQPGYSGADSFAYTVKDPSGAAASAIVTVDVVAAEEEVVVPVVGSTEGLAGSRFRTSMQLHNPSDTTIDGTLLFHSDAAGSAQAKTSSMSYSLPPHTTVAYPDLVPLLGADGIGTLDVRANGRVPAAVVRIYNDARERGTLGFAMPLLRGRDAVVAGQEAVLIAPADPARWRFNIGTRALRDGATLRLTVRDAGGALRRVVTKELGPGTFRQTSAADFTGGPIEANDSIAILVERGAAFVYGSTIDNVTNDPSLQLAQSPSAAAAMIPVAGATAGAFGAQFRTTLQLHNPTDEPISGRAIFHPQAVTGSANDPSYAYAIAPHATVAVPDFVAGAGGGGIGSIDLVPSSGTVPLAVARIFNDWGASGTAGLELGAASGAQIARKGASVRLIVPPSLADTRFNIGIRSTASGASLQFTVRDEGGRVLGTISRDYPPDFFTQQPAASFLGIPLGGNESITVTVDEGAAILYGAAVDNLSQDPTVQLAQP